MKNIVKNRLTWTILAWVVAIASNIALAEANMSFDCGPNLKLHIENSGWSWGAVEYKGTSYGLTPYSVGTYPIFNEHNGWVASDEEGFTSNMFFMQKAATDNPQANTPYRAYYANRGISDISQAQETYTCQFLGQ